MRDRGLALRMGDAAWIAAAGLVAAVLAGMLAWSAYAVHPLVLPVLLLVGALVVLTFLKPAWGIGVALAATPLEAIELPLPSGTLSPSEVALALVAGVWLFRVLFLPETVAKPRVRDVPVFVLLGAVASGLAIATDPAPVLRVFFLWTAFYFVYLQAQSLTEREVRGVAMALAAGAGVLGVIGAIGYVRSGATGVLAGGTITRARAVGTFDDANYYASLLTLALLPGLALALADFRRYAWLLAAVGAGVLGLAFSLSRGGIAGFAVGLLVLLAWARARWIALALVMAFALFTAIGANPILQSEYFGAVEERVTTITEARAKRSVNESRPAIWRQAVELTVEHPFLGVGVNQFEVESSRRGLYERGEPLENAHSIPLSFASETGLIGLAAFIAFAVQLARRAGVALQARDRRRFALALGITAALVAFGLQGLTVTQIRQPLIMGTFFVLAGLLTNLADRQRREPSERPAD